ncbi:uncharacterized protein B0H64DRAFT_420741 [Chaetomium fimeti]|uniref:Mid2 domain-containing protein n=1 Tax=Chaetomium fimeti TaxID=1854472 RepID=A0AAE0H710_9PEZI|nr:hypothetical protein B0H64DRAFT_420741 [Chaetomium fimeti]
MVKLGVYSALIWAAGLVSAAATPAPLVEVRTRNLPGTSDEHTRHLIWRRLADLARTRRQNVFENSASLDKSWNDATVFSYSYEADTAGTKLENLTAEFSIEVKCVTCYFKAGATAQLTIGGDFDIGDTIRNVTGQVKDELGDLVRTTVESIDDAINLDELKQLVGPGDFEMDEFIDFSNVSIDTDIDINFPPLPEVQLLFQIDHMDLYMEMDTTIAAGVTLTIPLYKSQTAFGITLMDGLEAGVFVTLDLILSVEGEITIRSGFHLLLDDPVGFKLALFGQNVSDVIFVAEFLTNITGGAELAAQEGCALKIVQEYTLAVGAAAGATVAVGPHTWGLEPNTTIPLFYTTLADICAITADATPTPTAAVAARQEEDDPNLETHTLTTKVLYTGISCASPGLPACPQSLQSTTLRTSTQTHVTAVPSGVTPTFPASTALSVASTIPFGKQVNKLAATSGAPVSYVPPPPPPTSSARPSGKGDDDGVGDVLDDIGEVFQGETGGVSNKLIIGLSVGLGVPILAAIIAALVHYLKRKKYAPVPKSDVHKSDMTAVEYTGGYDSPMAAEREAMVKKTPDVATSEVQH